MKEKRDFNRIVLPSILITALILVTMMYFALRFGDPRMKEADEQYHAGERALTIDEREKAFNKALELYLALDGEYNPQFGTGRLYYNIANTYFQLGEYGSSILFYEKARALLPRDGLVLRNLNVAKNKLNLPKTAQEDTFGRIFFFITFFSLPERLQIFFGLCVLALIFISAYLWMPNPWYKSAAIALSALIVLFMLSLGYTRYISPLEGVLTQAFDLRRDAGLQYAKVGKDPIAAGTKVEVLDIRSDGRWLKVLAPNGDLGYVSNEAIGLIGPQ